VNPLDPSDPYRRGSRWFIDTNYLEKGMRILREDNERRARETENMLNMLKTAREMQAYAEEQQRREREQARIWERTLRDGTRLIGVTGDRSHTHYGDDFISMRAEDEPRVHLRWKRNPVTGEYDE
jgi:hypothetical protein